MNITLWIKCFSKKCLYVCLFLAVNYSGLAQMSSGEDEIQNPLSKLANSFYPKPKKPVKSFLYIINKDTISKSSYDKNGNEFSKIDYEKNKPFYKTLSKYSANQKTESAFFVNNILQSTTTYTYDARKNLVEWKVMKTVYDQKALTSKLVEDMHWIIEFNERNRMKKRYSMDALQTKLLSFDYTYDASNKLIEIDEKQWKNTYVYKDDMLVNRHRFFKNDGSLYASSEYRYNDANLLIESSDKNYTYQYSYDLQVLKKMTRLKNGGSVSQEIDFYNTKNLLSKVEISTTDSNMNPEFIFESDYLNFSWDKNGINKLKMEFIYDSHNNIIEIKYFIKDAYKYSKLFVYQYY